MATTQRLTGTINATAGSLKTFLDTNLPFLGWTVSFTAGNTSTYRQGIEVNNKFRARNFYHLDDNGPGLSTFQESRIWQAESASAAGFIGLTDVSPTAIQASTGLFIRKSFTLDLTARTVILIGNERSVYLLIQTGDATTDFSMTFLGDFVPIVRDEVFPTVIIARSTENSGTVGNDRGCHITTSISNLLTGHFMVRDVNGILKSVPFSKSGDYVKTGFGTFCGTGTIVYPNATTGLPVFSDLALTNYINSQGSYFGTMPGVIYPCHNRPFGNLDTFTMGSKTYEVFNCIGPAQICIETSNTWEV